uniref:Uncharacterized protein n=1 Tax=Chenopodium quinoa TaxID=63459 RepID=A0A803L9Y7_CHEQI
MGVSSNSKKLRRLPHVFSKVLELPFDSDADVVVEERHDCFKFTVEDDGGIAGVGYSSGVKAHVVEVHPGITKVVIRSRENLSRPIVDELELDVWRFRLPSSARPELATAVYARGGLVVIVPKNGWGEMDRRDGDGKGGFKGNMDEVSKSRCHEDTKSRFTKDEGSRAEGRLLNLVTAANCRRTVDGVTASRLGD